MTLNYLFLWIVGISCLSVLWRWMRSKDAGSRSWVPVAIGILIITFGGLLFWPQTSGLIGGGFWLALVVAPAVGIHRINRAVLQGRFKRAHKIARVVALLHPSHDWKPLPDVFRALALFEAGERTKAEEILTQVGATRSGLGRYAVANMYSLSGEWERLRNWAEGEIHPDVLRRDRGVLPLYLRALGETENLSVMLQRFEESKEFLAKDTSSVNAALYYLVVLSFCGQVKMVDALLEGVLSMMSDEIKLFWRATASSAAGSQVDAHSIFLELSRSVSPRISRGAAQRIEKAPAVFSYQAREHDRQILERLLAELNTRSFLEPSLTASRAKPRVTYLVMAVTTIVFLVQILLGGATDPEVLYRMGGLYPPAVLQGEWWRVVATIFLHSGFLHLAANMIGLLILGPSVEHSIGAFRFLVAYLGAGVGSCLIIVEGFRRGLLENTFMVGASGAVLGLIGVSLAILLLSWRRSPSEQVKRELKSILIILLLQGAFDLSTPRVSFQAHLYGVICGVVLGLLLHRRQDATGQ